MSIGDRFSHSDMAMMRLMAREDIGLALIPPIVVTDELTSGDLIDACSLPGATEAFSGSQWPE